MKKILLSSFFVLSLFGSLLSVEIKHLREFTLSQDNDVLIGRPKAFFVTEDDRIFAADAKVSDIKIFDLEGKLVKVFGRKGLGPNEFIMPFHSDYKKPFVLVVDRGRRRYFIYKKTGEDNLAFEKVGLNIDMPYDVKLMNDKKILVVGDKMDETGRWYNLYIYDFVNNQYDFLSPLEISYGYESYKAYKIDAQDTLKYIGAFQYCDWVDNYIYRAWTGDIRIFKFNLKTRERISFGKKTENYVPPYVTPDIKKAYNAKKPQPIIEAKSKMSYVKNLFISKSKNVGLVYVGPLKKNKGINVMLQLYTPSGGFINELEVLLNAKASTSNELYFYFKRDKNLLYVIDTETSEEFEQAFKVHEYRIEE